MQTVEAEDSHKTKAALQQEVMLLSQRVADLEGQSPQLNGQTHDTIPDSEHWFHMLFEYAPDAYYLNDLEARFVDGNRAAEKTIGYQREELIGKNFLEVNILSPDQLPKAAEILEKIRKASQLDRMN